MNTFIQYIKESRAELKRVAWPNRSQTIKLTLAVIIFTLVLSVISGVLDYTFSQILQRLILKG